MQVPIARQSYNFPVFFSASHRCLGVQTGPTGARERGHLEAKNGQNQLGIRICQLSSGKFAYLGLLLAYAGLPKAPGS